MTDQPAFKLRDGAITATAWPATSEKNDKVTIFYNIDVVRSYKDSNGEWKETTSFSGGDVLKASNLLVQAYNKTLELKADAKE